MGYCNTGHFLQGKTIDGDLNIIELNKMTFENAMVCFSRIRNLDNLRVDKVDYNKVFKSEYDEVNLINEINGEKVFEGIVYFYNDIVGDRYYIGVSMREDESRFKEHVISKGYDIEKFEIVCNVICTKNKLRDIERKFIKKYSKIYGDKLENIYENGVDKNRNIGSIGNNKVIEKRYNWSIDDVYVSVYDSVLKKQIIKRRHKKNGIDKTKLLIIENLGVGNF